MRSVIRLATTAIAATCAITGGVRVAHAETTAQSNYTVSCPGFPTDSVSEDPGPAEANWPVTSGINLGMTDFGPAVTGIHVDTTTLKMASYQRLTDAGSSAQTRCDLHGDLANTVTVGAGTSGLAAGDPVTVVASMSLAGTLGYAAKSGSFTADSNATVKFQVTDPGNFGHSVVSYTADGYSIADGASGDPTTGAGGFVSQQYKHDLWLTSNAAPSVSDTPSEVYNRPLTVWPNGNGFANAPVDFGADIGPRSIAFTTTVGATLDIVGSVDTTELTSGGIVASTADIDGFAASFAADPANDGITLTLGTDAESEAATTTSASADEPSYVYGEPVILSAHVASSGGVATGSVSFSDGATLLGTSSVDASGNASVTVSAGDTSWPLVTGAHTITASYAGASGFTASSGTVVINLDKAATKTTLAVFSSKKDQPTLLRAAVTTVTPGQGVPAGSVTFYVDKTTVATYVLFNGEAVGSVPAKQLHGKHTVSAVYNPDVNHLTSSAQVAAPKA